MKRVALAAALLATAALGAGCTSSTHRPRPVDTTITHTVVETSTPTSPSTTFTPDPVATVRPLKPGSSPRSGETEKVCPYIRTGLDQDSGGGVNMADLEGDRIYRTTVLTGYSPVGCRFYFYSGPFEAVADIRPRTLPTPIDAYNAMVLTARTGRNPITEKDFVPGLTGISFQTAYFGPDGRADWAFVFAKKNVVVAVYTQRKDTSRNAVYIARAIAAKF